MPDEPIDLERQGWRALATDGATARRFYDEVLGDRPVMLFPGGLRLDDRDTILDSLGGRPWSSFELADEQVTRPADGVAVVSYRASARRGDDPAYDALIASVYVEVDGRWRLVLHQHTPVS